MWWFAVARAQDLPELAVRDGFAAAHEAVRELVARTKPRKLPAALATARLGDVEMPVETGLGAELVVTGTTPARDCTWSSGALACRFTLSTTSIVADGEYEVTCRSRLGASLKIPSRVASATPGEAVVGLPDLGPCWDLGDTLVVTPVSGLDLEGVGIGNDLVPPELVGLTKGQVEATIKEGTAGFRHCLVTAGGAGLTGKLVVAYHIAPDGTVDRAEVESSTLGSEPVTACVLQRFRAMTFPKPNDGWNQGTWPISFQ